VLSGKENSVDTTSDSGAAVDVQTADAPSDPPQAIVVKPVLQPKGSCWYCEKPLDSVRRFCCRGCADAFAEESAFIR
jgi:hypothetical protein